MKLHKPRLIFASALAATTAIVFVVVITVWAELSIPLKDWLKNFSGHHWTSKSVFSVLVYAATTAIWYWGSRNQSENALHKMLVLLLVFTALGVFAITSFYSGHYFGLF